MVRYTFFRIGRDLAHRLSAPQAYRMASFLSTLQWAFSLVDRWAVEANLNKIAGPSLKRRSREVFLNFGYYLVEFFRMDRDVNDDFISRSVDIIGRGHLEKALEQKKGAILVSAHLGNWELGGGVIARLGHRLSAIALPHKDPRLNALFDQQRRSQGVDVIPIQQAGKKGWEALRRGEVLALIADRDFTGRGIPLPFLGSQKRFPKGPAVFSFKTGAPIVPTYCIRLPDRRFCLGFESPLWPPVTINGEIAENDLAAMMRRYVAVFEAWIRRWPTQWLMFRRFWKE